MRKILPYICLFSVVAFCQEEIFPIQSTYPNSFLPVLPEQLSQPGLDLSLGSSSNGTNCGGSSAFSINIFYVTPYPPKKDEEIHTVMLGKFREKTLLSQVIIGLKHENRDWKYFTFDYNIQFEADAKITLTNHVKMPSERGIYTLTYEIYSNRCIACRQLDFKI